MLSWKKENLTSQNSPNSHDTNHDMDIEKREILRAIAEMAYVIAKAEHGISSEERIAFFNIVAKELGDDSWVAQSHFELLDEVTHPSLDKAYNAALFELQKHKGKFTPELKEKALSITKQIAESFGGLGENEAFILDRLKKDIQHL